MREITFIDLEVSVENNHILDFGGIKSTGENIHSSSLEAFQRFLLGSDYLCGHNIFNHDLKHLLHAVDGTHQGRNLARLPVIDTLYLSPLLFPQRPYHALLKDDKLQIDELNNPLNDSQKAKDLFYDELAAFQVLPQIMKSIFGGLLAREAFFKGFFQYLAVDADSVEVEPLLWVQFQGKVCNHAPISRFIQENPVELTYCLALLYANDDYSITPPWIFHQYPEVNRIMHFLRGKPCLPGCDYCNEYLDARHGLKRFFGYDSYREFDGVSLQEQAVKAALANKSLLAIFPTGGGKSITFQVPALLAGYSMKGLTVIISPLQSLMKDQVDNLERRGITDAVTINGLLDPIERAVSLQRVESGEAMILYISPESLRSRTIERLLSNRCIARFVIDEAHCFSAWGQDFRVDYLYIAEFIQNLCIKKNLSEIIPVSCFTATAKQNVIEDIMTYFKENLNLDLELFTTSTSRKNLHYRVLEKHDDEKYLALRDLLASKNCPAIVYVSRTAKATELANRLTKDGYHAEDYHGRMDKKEKSSNQEAFTEGTVNTIVATSAFGMGVDKKDVGLVVHYDIADSLENYVQEAGRAGRDENISADCYVLFNDEDLNKHFLLLNQTKICINEIQQVWQSIKNATRNRTHMSNSALEIAREAGWDENVKDVETRVKTAISALENAGYVKRGQNMPRIFADSILAHNAIEAIGKLQKSGLFTEKDEMHATRIIKKLIGSRSRSKASPDDAESRVDYIADDLGLERVYVIHLVQLLREANVLSDAKDLTGYIDETGSAKRSLNLLKTFHELELFLLYTITDTTSVVNIKELNEKAEEKGMKKVTPERVRTIMNYWVVKNLIKKELSRNSPNLVTITFLKDKKLIKEDLQKRHGLSDYILHYLEEINTKKETTVAFSVLELMNAFNAQMKIDCFDVKSNEVENALYYMTKISALKLDGGFLVTYNGISIERLELDNKIRYKADDYKNLKRYYEQKTQMIHIVGEYAKMMMENYQSALQFVEDYFQLEYSSFLRKYFRGSKGDEIQSNISPKKFRQLFGELSVPQLSIIKDKESQIIVVGAGPGSGKTKILVHKLASLLLMEDVKHEQLLMVTFSRAAATEFKKRLQDLIQNAAHFVDIKTFHSFCFDLLGKVGNLEKSANIIQEAIQQIENNEVELSRITRTVMVIDEAQDMDVNEFKLIRLLIQKNEGIRVIAVGDDDQNIYTFRGSDSKYMRIMRDSPKAKFYELVNNYRSQANLVEFTNLFLQTLKNRMKTTPIMPVKKEMGSIRIIRYESNQLITPVVNKLIDEGIHGSTCILTKSNDEALQLTGLLQKEKIHAKLIQSSEKYDLYNLVEIRYFLDQLQLSAETYIIHEEVWESAKSKLKERYAKSTHLPMCETLIDNFEVIYNKHKYHSDLVMFIRESKEEDFINLKYGAVFVSTMHKAKGREFDHVVIVLDHFYINDDEAKRLLYVAMTRAKQTLTIHYNGDYLQDSHHIHYSQVEGLYYEKDTKRYADSGFIVIQLLYYDVFLSYFSQVQDTITKLMSDDELMVYEWGCADENGMPVLRFSRKFCEDIQKKKEKGYLLKRAKVNHICYWRQEDAEKEILVLFPEVEFEKL